MSQNLIIRWALVLLTALPVAMLFGEDGTKKDKVARKEPAKDAEKKEAAPDSKKEIRTYLLKKTGAVALAPMPKGNALLWCSQQYSDAGKLKNPAALYRLLHANLLRADQLLNGKEVSNQRIGLGMVFEAVSCAVDRLNDKWLATRICDVYLIPHLDAAEKDSTAFLSEETLINVVIYTATKAEDNPRYIEGYKLLLKYGNRVSNQNTADAARLKLAEVLEKEGELEEAYIYLREIDEKGSLSGGSQMMLPRIKEKLEAKKKATFTVFRVTIDQVVSDPKLKGADVIPEGADASFTDAGLKFIPMRLSFVQSKSDDTFGISLIKAADPVDPKKMTQRVLGGIYFRGRIDPVGIDPADFNKLSPNREDASFGVRTITERVYINNVLQGSPLDEVLFQDAYDHLSGFSRDETPNADIKDDKHLYVASFDTPGYSISDRLNRGDLKSGDIVRYRFYAVEYWHYAGVVCSNFIPWHCVWSGKIDKDNLFVFLGDVEGDKTIGKESIWPTPNLLQAKQPPPEPTEIEEPKPTDVKYPPPIGVLKLSVITLDKTKDVVATVKIKGKNFVDLSDKNKKPIVYITRNIVSPYRVSPFVIYGTNVQVVDDSHLTITLTLRSFVETGTTTFTSSVKTEV